MRSCKKGSWVLPLPISSSRGCCQEDGCAYAVVCWCSDHLLPQGRRKAGQKSSLGRPRAAMADAMEEIEVEESQGANDYGGDNEVEGILIRLGDTGRNVHILPEDLPNTPHEVIIDIFQAEWAKPRQFIRLAVSPCSKSCLLCAM